MRSTGTKIAATLWLLSCNLLNSVQAADDAVNAASNEPELASTAVNVEVLGGFDSPLEVHEVVVTLEQVSGEANAPRHQEERARLHNALRKDVGTWDTNHPRHRLLEALHSYRRYYDLQKKELDRIKGLYRHTSKLQKKLLEKEVGYSKKFTRIDHVLSETQQLCERIIENALDFYNITWGELKEHIKLNEEAGRKPDKVSTSQALKHYVRDWTEDGAEKRELPFGCSLNTLKSMFPDRSEDAPLKILIPGSGLGRLGYEIAGLGGFEVTLNEWSMYMNVAYRLLEKNRLQNSHSVHPFATGWSHHATEANMLRALPFPDTTLNATAVVMMEGDFTNSFNHQLGHYDVVFTYFFIDTARNLLSYFDTIKKILKPGGHWVNLGPLLYGTGPFVQLSLEEIAKVTEAMGFEYLDTDEACGELTFEGRKIRGLKASYGFDSLALTEHAYNAQFWVARKK